MQDACFGHLHAAGVPRVLVVFALEMQRAVDNQVRQMMPRRTALSGGLGTNDTKSQDDL